MGRVFEKQYEINYYNLDNSLKCKITSILDFFCDIGMQQSEELGVGVDSLTARNLTWVFYKYNINMKRYPRYGEKIRIITDPIGFKKFYAFRDYTILDEGNKVIGEGKSLFFLIDLAKRRPTRIPKDLYEAYGCADEIKDNPTIVDPEKLEEEQYFREFYVRRSDIDSNKHVNNTKYVEWALEVIPDEIVDEYELDNISIVYSKEITYGHMVKTKCSVHNEDNGIIKIRHLIQDDEGRDITLINTFWRKN